MLYGANDGARTRDNQNHNLGLYQLSYVRHIRSKIIAFVPKTCQKTLSRHFQTQRQPNPLGLSWHLRRNQQWQPCSEL